MLPARKKGETTATSARACTKASPPLNTVLGNGFSMISGIFLISTAPSRAKQIWLAALRAIITGVVIKKPSVVPKQTTAASFGDMNIAIKIATWLASVNDIGPITILGISIGTTIPIPHSTPANTS